MEASQSMEEACWEYLDPKDVKQGPFSGTRMLLWYQNNMLPEDLRVRHTPSMPFTPIKELFKATNQPFKSRPKPAGPCMWQYRDTQGQLQGPFTSAQMSQWHGHDMLPKNLQIRRATDTQFATIAEYFPEPLVPFLSPPVTPAKHQAGLGDYAGGGGGGGGFGGGLGGFSLGNGMAAIAHASAAMAAAKAKAPPAGPPPKAAQANPAAAVAVGVQQQQQQQQAAVPKQPAAGAAAKGKADAKAKAAAKVAGDPACQLAGVSNNHAEMLGPKGVKGKGKGEGPVGAGVPQKGGGKKNAAKEQEAWEWSEAAWAGADKAWWEWAAWNGAWAGEGWEAGPNGKQQGAEWKGKGGEVDGGPIGASPQKEKGEHRNAVQAAFGGLPWGPQVDAPDLFPEDTMRKVQDEGIVWEERWVCPLLVRFSQGKIHPFFHGRGPISEVMLQIRLHGEEKDGSGGAFRRIEPPFPPIRLLHMKEQGVLVTLDNRRLYALQRFALQEWPSVCIAKALCVDELTPTRLRAENRKFTNRLCGLQLEVESRSNAFDTFSWVTEAAHAEAPRFCRPVALRAADKTEKAVSLLPVLVVHTLLCPRLREHLRSRWPLLQLVAGLLRSPQRRDFPTRRLLLHHVLELPKPSRRIGACPPLCVGYKSETVVTLSKGRSCVTSKLSISRPLQLLHGSPLSGVQRRVLAALLPLFCLPYARSALRGGTRDWVEAVLLAWGKVAAARLQLPQSL